MNLKDLKRYDELVKKYSNDEEFNEFLNLLDSMSAEEAMMERIRGVAPMWNTYDLLRRHLKEKRIQAR